MATFLLRQSHAYKFLTLFGANHHQFLNLTIIWHTASTPKTLIAFPTQYHHHSIMSTSQSTSISSPQTHTFNVYTIDPRSYHYLITRYEPALTRPQCAYLLDPNRRSSKSPKHIYLQPGDPIILYPGLTQLDYLGDKIDGINGLQRMSGDELVERHWYKVHKERPTPATDQVPVLFRARMMQRPEEGTVEEAKNNERKRWIKSFVASCLKLLGCFGRNRGR